MTDIKPNQYGIDTITLRASKHLRAYAVAPQQKTAGKILKLATSAVHQSAWTILQQQSARTREECTQKATGQSRSYKYNPKEFERYSVQLFVFFCFRCRRNPSSSSPKYKWKTPHAWPQTKQADKLKEYQIPALKPRLAHFTSPA